MDEEIRALLEETRAMLEDSDDDEGAAAGGGGADTEGGGQSEQWADCEEDCEEEEEELASEESTVDDESPDAAVATIQEMLDEAKGRGAESIRFIVETIGPARSLALLEEVLMTEAAGGTMTKDGMLRRTPGGAFLAILSEGDRCSAAEKKEISARRNRMEKLEKKAHEKRRRDWEARPKTGAGSSSRRSKLLAPRPTAADRNRRPGRSTKVFAPVRNKAIGKRSSWGGSKQPREMQHVRHLLLTPPLPPY